ncbi:hypothetical protein ACFL46_03195 [Candidatus Neomarinimicrobiota bacterium]
MLAYKIQKVNYFYTTVEDLPGEAYKLLSLLSDIGINLLAFTTVPMGPTTTQLSIFPEDALKMSDTAKKAGLTLDGPHSALLVQGDDALGALVSIHEKLYEARVNVFASSGVSDGKGGYGYLLYVRPEEYDRAASALEI